MEHIERYQELAAAVLQSVVQDYRTGGSGHRMQAIQWVKSPGSVLYLDLVGTSRVAFLQRLALCTDEMNLPRAAGR